MTRIKAHPGALLREELEARGMSANALAMRLGVPAGRITEIIHEKRAITPDTAIRLAEFFGGEPRFWINIQAAHDLSKIEAEQGDQIRGQVRRAG